MKNLIYNELIKLRAQKSYLVLSCLVLAIVILSSFASSILLTPGINFIAYGWDFLNHSAGYKWAAETIRENPDSPISGLLGSLFNDPKTDADLARKQADEYLKMGYVSYSVNLLAQAEFYDYKENNDVPDWIASKFQDELVSLYRWRKIVVGLRDGVYTPDEVADYMDQVLDPGFAYIPIYIVYLEYDYETNRYTYEFRTEPQGEEEEGQLCTFSEVMQVLEYCLPMCEQQIATYEQQIPGIEADEYYRMMLETVQREKLQCTIAIEDAERQLANHTGTKQEEAQLQRQLEIYRYELADCEIREKGYVYLRDNGLSPDTNAHTIVHDLLPSVVNMRHQERLTVIYAEETEEDESVDMFTKILMIASANASEVKIRVLDQSLVAIEYAYQHDMMIDGMSSSFCKDVFEKNISNAAFLISIVAVVLASMILSREYATGTVRLWVIRPKTRTKLLISKIAALFVYICGMMLICFGITYTFALVNHLLDLFFYGESTLFLPDYAVILDKVILIPAIVEHLWMPVALSLPILLYAMGCLFISVLTKKGVLSIAFGMMAVMFAPYVQTALLGIANLVGGWGYLLQLTVFPYLSIQNLFGSVMDYAVSSAGGGSILDMLDCVGMLGASLQGAMPYTYSAVFGAVLILLHIVVLVIAGLWVFKKTQIKS